MDTSHDVKVKAKNIAANMLEYDIFFNLNIFNLSLLVNLFSNAILS